MAAAPKGKPDTSLPEVLDISLKEFTAIYPTWIQWQATGKRFLPTDLRKQPQALLDGILYLDALMEKIVGQMMERMEKE